MDRGAIKEFVYGGVTELMHNRKYYYHSAVGADYSHWTTEGEKALTEFMNMIGHKMLQAEEAEIRVKAKEMTMNALKGESK